MTERWHPQSVNIYKACIKIPNITSEDKRMDLHSMIKKIEKKHILTINHDYNMIGFDEIQMMRRILYTILTTPEICNNADTFEFINTNYTKHL